MKNPIDAPQGITLDLSSITLEALRELYGAIGVELLRRRQPAPKGFRPETHRFLSVRETTVELSTYTATTLAFWHDLISQELRERGHLVFEVPALTESTRGLYVEFFREFVRDHRKTAEFIRDTLVTELDTTGSFIWREKQAVSWLGEQMRAGKLQYGLDSHGIWVSEYDDMKPETDYYDTYLEAADAWGWQEPEEPSETTIDLSQSLGHALRSLTPEDWQTLLKKESTT